MYKYLFFDLDGTVTDSAEGIYNSVAYALEKLGFPVEDKTTLRPFIGPPLTESFKNFCGFDEEKTKLGVQYYREYYPEKGIFENKVYDGIPELLKKLHDSGKKVILATSKPEPFAVRILEHFGIAQYFDLIVGSTFDTSRQNKADVLRYAVQTIGADEPERSLMIGDRLHDVVGAHEIGMDCAYVLFGFGSREEAAEYKAEYIIDTVDSLGEFLMGA